MADQRPEGFQDQDIDRILNGEDLKPAPIFTGLSARERALREQANLSTGQKASIFEEFLARQQPHNSGVVL
jgi:hypothetical protein